MYNNLIYMLIYKGTRGGLKSRVKLSDNAFGSCLQITHLWIESQVENIFKNSSVQIFPQYLNKAV